MSKSFIRSYKLQSYSQSLTVLSRNMTWISWNFIFFWFLISNKIVMQKMNFIQHISQTFNSRIFRHQLLWIAIGQDQTAIHKLKILLTTVVRTAWTLVMACINKLGQDITRRVSDTWISLNRSPWTDIGFVSKTKIKLHILSTRKNKSSNKMEVPFLKIGITDMDFLFPLETLGSIYQCSI